MKNKILKKYIPLLKKEEFITLKIRETKIKIIFNIYNSSSLCTSTKEKH
jgi:hypothetical protein